MRSFTHIEDALPCFLCLASSFSRLFYTNVFCEVVTKTNTEAAKKTRRYRESKVHLKDKKKLRADASSSVHCTQYSVDVYSSVPLAYAVVSYQISVNAVTGLLSLPLKG